jgi:hypothetical protein
MIADIILWVFGVCLAGVLLVASIFLIVKDIRKGRN